MNFYDELTHDLIRLQSLIGALDVVHDTGSVAGDGMDCGPHVKRARNATPTLIETIERQTEALIAKTERAATNGRPCLAGTVQNERRRLQQDQGRRGEHHAGFGARHREATARL
jgi:hypothetical protein